MPIFFNNKLLFIHIPKTGGTSIEKLLEDSGDKMSFYTFSGSIFVNGHTPQHCTYRELEDLNILNSGLKVFTIIRDPEERVISEYFYIKNFRPKINKHFSNFTEFLDLFLNYENLSLFDNHNLSQFDFLKNSKGEIDTNLNMFEFFDIQAIEKFIGVNGLDKYNSFKTLKGDFTLSRSQSKKIKKFYSKDYLLFNDNNK